MSTYQRIYSIVSMIPYGNVATYGQIARISNCSARTVGYALSQLSPATDVPWRRREVMDIIRQRGEMEKENILFDCQGRVNLEDFGWIGDY